MTELGTRLKEARTAKGYSLDDLQEMTKIQKRYLAGIEEGNYSMMPGPFYIRAFIKQYADAVGLNSDELLESYKQEVPSSTSEEVRQTMTTAPSRRRPIGRSSNSMNEMIPMILVALFIIIGIVIFWFFYQNLAKNDDPSENAVEDEVSIEQPTEDDVATDASDEEKPKDETPVEEEAEETVVEPEPTQKIEMGAIDGQTTNYTITVTDSVSLKIVSRGRSWVAVTDQAGVERIARELSAGETVTLDLSDAQTARIRVGATPQIDVFINDEKIEYGSPTAEKITQNMMIQFSKQQ